MGFQHPSSPPWPSTSLLHNQETLSLEETKAFFKIVMGIHLPEETIQEVTARTEGWLVGLQLLALSLPEQADSMTLLKEVSGDQRYILDYLTEEVLRKQPQDVQRFVLCTSILERFSASLCDAVLEQTGSQQILQWLDQAHLFLTALDSKRQWYRYHALFAQALHYRLEQMSPDLVFLLHYRASLWYAEHGFSTQAILHAFRAHQWQWAANLIERLPSLLLLTWGAGEEVTTFRAILQSLQKNGHVALSLCQQALALLSPENSLVRTLVASAQLWAYYTSAANDATRAIHRGFQAVSAERPS